MNANTFGIVLGIAGIVIGLAASYYFYWKSLRIKEPSWDIQSNNLIRGHSSKVPELQIFFKDEPVQDLTISRVVFWNNGAETIDRQDLNTINPLRITSIAEVKLLETKVVSVNNTSNQISIRETVDKSCAYLEFDYLDQAQGAVIQVVHTGISSKDLTVEGDIRGVKALRRVNVPLVRRSANVSVAFPQRFGQKARRKVMLIIVFGIIILMTILIILFIVSYIYFTAPEMLVILLFSLVAFVPLLYLYAKAGIRLLGRTAPHGLEAFEEDIQL